MVPFLKWAGSKRRLVETLSGFSPKRLSRYYEPFLGSGALFFYLAQTKPKFHAILSDSNEELVNSYKCVRDNVEDVIDILLQHQENYYQSPDEYYYFIRNGYECASKSERAARLIFLNRTCYNGLYRVNKSGLFNVPHGTYFRPRVCQTEKLRMSSSVLQSTEAEILYEDYRKVISRCTKGDFVYLDPPYFPVTKTANFKDYTIENFDFLHHIALANEFRRLHNLECTVLLSNSNVGAITSLYSEYAVKAISTNRSINCNGMKRKNHSEVIVSNKKILASNIITIPIAKRMSAMR